MNFFGPNGLILDRPGQGFAKKVCRLEYANAWARLLERIIHSPGNLQFWKSLQAILVSTRVWEFLDSCVL